MSTPVSLNRGKIRPYKSEERRYQIPFRIEMEEGETLLETKGGGRYQNPFKSEMEGAMTQYENRSGCVTNCRTEMDKAKTY